MSALALGYVGLACGLIAFVILPVAWVIAICVVSKRDQGRVDRWEAERVAASDALAYARGLALEGEFRVRSGLDMGIAEEFESFLRAGAINQVEGKGE